MALLRLRPLALSALVFCMVTLCCLFLSSGVLWGIGAVAFALLCCLLPLFIKKKGGYVRLCLILICLAALLACVRGGLFAVRRERAEMLSGEFIEAELVVRDVLQQSSYSCELLVSVTVSDDLPYSLAVLRAESPLPFYLGDRISGEFYVENLAFEAYRPGVEYEYLGEGAAWLLIPTQLDALVLCESGADSFSARLGLWRATLCRRICSVVDGEGGVLLSAMLLGEREALSAQTVRDFRRIGTSHLLAISGLHLSILVLLLDRFLYLIGAGRRIRVALVLPAVLAYAVLVGGGFSVLRAALMLLVCYLALLLRADHDPLTALAVSAALILAATPGAIFDTSFQMTVLATFGLLSFGRLQSLLLPLIPKRKGAKGALLALLRFTVSSLLVSFAASFAILPVSYLTFGEVSLLTPLSNLLLVPFVTPLLLLGVLTLLLPVLPLGFLAGLPAKVILTLSAALSRIDGVLSLRYDFVPFVLLPVFLVTAVLLLVDLKRLWALVVAPALCGALAFGICLAATFCAGSDEALVCYRRTGENEGLVVMQNNVAVLCDASNGSLTQLRNDYYLATEMGATRIEALFLTHYHRRMISSVSAFSAEVLLRELWVPAPQTREEGEILSALTALAAQQKISLRVFAPNEPLSTSFGVVLTRGELYFETRSTQPAFSLSLSYGERILCYHTAALSEFLRNTGGTHNCTATTLLLGAHGPVPHAPVELPEGEALGEVLVGSEQALKHLAMRPFLHYYFYDERLCFWLK